jgi:hypothetical protein
METARLTRKLGEDQLPAVDGRRFGEGSWAAALRQGCRPIVF